MLEARAKPQTTLTPLVNRHRDTVTQALRALLGLPESIALTWRQDGRNDDDGWIYVLSVGGDQTNGGLGLEISAAAVGRQARLRGAQIHVAQRTQSSEDDTIWPALLRRLQAIDRGAAPGLLAELLQAQRIFAPFAPREDEDYVNFTVAEALLRIGFRCNQDCSFCWQGRDWPEPDLPTLERWLDEMAGQGARRVILSGGEPTVYLDTLLTLAKRARDVHGLPVYIQTNAIRLRQPHVLDALLEAGIVGTLISYHSADAVISDTITRAPGTHARTEEGICAAMAAGLAVDLNVVVERRTLPGLVERSRRIVEHFAQLRQKPNQLSTAFSFPTDYHDPEVYTRQVVPLDEVASQLAEAIRLLQEAGIRVAPVGSCGYPLCALAEVPTAIDLGVLDALAGEQLRSRVLPPICQDCALKGHCVGPRQEYLDRHGERGLRPFAQLPPELAAEVRRRGLDLPRPASMG